MGTAAAAFDTRADKSPWLTGAASRGIAKRLRRRGYEVLSTESFLVEDSEGPLVEGELERARAWGADLPSRSGRRQARPCDDPAVARRLRRAARPRQRHAQTRSQRHGMNDAYPVRLAVAYPDRQLDRLSSALRIFTVIPIAIVLASIGGYSASRACHAGTPAW
jgi:hypothetical protein